MNIFESILRKLFGQPKVIVKTSIPRPPFSTFKIEEWRNSRVRVDYINGLFNDPMFRDLIGTIFNSLVVRKPETLDGDSYPHLCSLELGRALGHQDVLALFDLLRTEMPKQNEIEQLEEEYIPIDIKQPTQE